MIWIHFSISRFSRVQIELVRVGEHWQTCGHELVSSPKLPSLILQFLHRAAPGDFWRRDSGAGDRNFPSGCVWWPELELLLPLSQCYRWFSCSKVESLPDFCLCPGHWAAFPMSQLRWVLSVIPSSWLELLPHSMWLLHFSELQKGHSEQSALKPCF